MPNILNHEALLVLFHQYFVIEENFRKQFSILPILLRSYGCITLNPIIFTNDWSQISKSDLFEMSWPSVWTICTFLLTTLLKLLCTYFVFALLILNSLCSKASLENNYPSVSSTSRILLVNMCHGTSLCICLISTYIGKTKR